MYLKRQIHFTEPPSEFEMPFVRVQVEKSIVDLDPADLGTPDNNITVEVRVEEAGALEVGPILLGAQLTDNTQYVEVTMQVLGKRDDGRDRDPVKFTFNFADQSEPRYWMVYTGQKSFVPKFQYWVRVVVKGTLFTHGQEWSTVQPIISGGSGGIMITVPTPDDPNVTKRAIPLSAFASAGNGQAMPSPDGGYATPPPSTPVDVIPPPATPARDLPPVTPGTYGGVSGWTAGPAKDVPSSVGDVARGAPLPGEDVVFTGFEPAAAH
jgi:hypothetical protein